MAASPQGADIRSRYLDSREGSGSGLRGLDPKVRRIDSHTPADAATSGSTKGRPHRVRRIGGATLRRIATMSPLAPDPNATRAWALALTAIPSVTGTADEAAFSPRFADMLRASPALAGAAAEVWTVLVPGGRFPRACVAVLVRGCGADTVMLTGHFDTVHTEDYGDLRPLALDPEALRPALLARLAEPNTAREQQALDDLAAGFLPGRGLLDMKAGLAAGIAVLEAFAGDPHRYRQPAVPGGAGRGSQLRRGPRGRPCPS